MAGEPRPTTASGVGGTRAPTPEEIKDRAGSDRWVDLEEEAKARLWLPEGSSIEVIAPLAGFGWPMDDAGGDQSIVWYRVATDAEAGPGGPRRGSTPGRSRSTTTGLTCARRGRSAAGSTQPSPDSRPSPGGASGWARRLADRPPARQEVTTWRPRPLPGPLRPADGLDRGEDRAAAVNLPVGRREHGRRGTWVRFSSRGIAPGLLG